MSDDSREIFHHDHRFLPFAMEDILPLSAAVPGGSGGGTAAQVQSNMSFPDYLHGSEDPGSLARVSEFSLFQLPVNLGESNVSTMDISSTGCGGGGGVLGGGSGGGGGFGRTTPATPNSSVSSSSSEAAGEEDPEKCNKDQIQEQKKDQKGEEDADDNSKKMNISKLRKKGEKRERQPRFAFMTRSEVDHLEDGYRWRKYGQKAVKNSPYPRSYYRCTTQKCTVKKRVERSYQDPSVVVTTYEGQHTHQNPSVLRGGGAHPPAVPSAMPASFRHDLFMQQAANQLPTSGSIAGQHIVANPSFFLQTLAQPLRRPPDLGLLQDIVPSFIPNNQQP